MPALLVEAFPRDLRCSAASVAYNLSMAVFGGLSPMVATWLISRTQKDMAPAYLVIGAAVVALIAVLTLRETARRPLR
jgi:MHS family proline/betaine transporter-like MFS transporter